MPPSYRHRSVSKLPQPASLTAATKLTEKQKRLQKVLPKSVTVKMSVSFTLMEMHLAPKQKEGKMCIIKINYIHINPEAELLVTPH